MDKKYVIAKSFCTPSKLPASDFVINPYVGLSLIHIFMYKRYLEQYKKEHKQEAIAEIKRNKEIHMAALRTYAQLLKEEVSCKHDDN